MLPRIKKNGEQSVHPMESNHSEFAGKQTPERFRTILSNSSDGIRTLPKQKTYTQIRFGYEACSIAGAENTQFTRKESV